MLKPLFLFFAPFLVLIGLGYFVTFNSLDPDFGWHLKTGQLILERGVPKTDWYSFTIPDFPWIDHEWLTEVLIYKIYSIFGFQALLLFFLVISVFAFIILIKPKSFWFYLLPVVLGFLAILGFLGVRPQFVSILFIAILWKVLNEFLDYSPPKDGSSRYTGSSRVPTTLQAHPTQGRELPLRRSASRPDPKKETPATLKRNIFLPIYFLPLLFLIWVNLHGGFFAGLFILFLILILEIFKKTFLFKKLIALPFFQEQNYKKQPIKKISILCIVFVFSFLITLINPYGIRIYEEVFRTIGDPYLRFHIAEWLPLFFGTPYQHFIILYLVLFLGLLIPLRKKIEFGKLILLAVFLASSFLNQRHFVIFVILSIPVFAETIYFFQKEIQKEKLKALFPGFKKEIIFYFLLGFILILSSLGFYPLLKGVFLEDISSDYPQEALPFLKTLPLSENLFNEYGWGGYLIWKAPERKLFIDGRMPSWRKDGQFVFGDYVKIMEVKEGFQELLDRYDIKIMLLRNDKKEESKLNKEPKAENKLSKFLKEQKWLLKILGLLPQKNLSQELIKSGWQTIYEDEIAIILRKQDDSN